jgi:hypothetical protein
MHLGLAPELPEDLYFLIKKVPSLILQYTGTRRKLWCNCPKRKSQGLFQRLAWEEDLLVSNNCPGCCRAETS